MSKIGQGEKKRERERRDPKKIIAKYQKSILVVLNSGLGKRVWISVNIIYRRMSF
jgi:hypothetical protein